jgi:hypothetical protein
MLRSVAALSWPTDLKSFSPAHPSGRTGRGTEISTLAAIVSCSGGGEDGDADNFWAADGNPSLVPLPKQRIPAVTLGPDLGPRDVSE